MARKKNLVALGIALIAASALTACGGEDGSGGNKTLTIGALNPLTGPLAPLTPASEKSSKVAIAMVQDALKKSGLPFSVKLEQADSQGDPQAAVSAAKQLSSQGATCLTGPWGSAETVAVNEGFARTMRTPVVAIGSSPDISKLKDRDYLFRSLASDAVQGEAMAKLAAEQLGGTDKSVAVGARNDAYGQGVADAFVAAWKKGGGTIANEVLYDTAQASYDSEASKLVSGSPDGYVFADFPDPFAKVAASLVRTGKFDPKTAVLSDGLAFTGGVPKGFPMDAVEGAVGTAGLADGPSLKAYQAKFDATGGTKTSGLYEYNNADAVLICALAAVAADSTKPIDIAKKIREVTSPSGKNYSADTLSEAFKAAAAGDDINFEGIASSMDMDKVGDQITAGYKVYGYTGGKFDYTGEKIAVGGSK